MLHSFKLRMLAVILLITMIGIIMQSEHSSRKLVEPVLEYMMDNKYDVGKLVNRYIKLPGTFDLNEALSVSSHNVLQRPCEYIDIERSYGWHWNQEERKQKFNPGIFLKVKNDTVIRPVLEGQVVDIIYDEDQATILIKHDADIYSLYGGLREVLADKGSTIGHEESIGRTGESFYFEIRGKDGSVNPQSIFK
ncbi:MAG: peptidoglycan DD-metalloendopeptidase family protein [Syntrophomonas sp.]|nr:peptidoglycan DD-metalloendopeptidase family protein [Syntrophomonas sp.]